jgi:hypothetical protein
MRTLGRMPMFRWIGKLLPILTFLSIRKRYQRGVSLIKIKAVKAYLLGIKTIRIFFLGALFVLFSLVLFASGLLLLHIALFTYSGWTVQVKFFVALLLGGLEIFAASGILFYLFSEETWVKLSGIKHLPNSVLKKESE